MNITLPQMRCAADLAKALGAVAEAVGNGEVSPEEGQAIASILDTQRKKSLETDDMERRLAALELRSGIAASSDERSVD